MRISDWSSDVCSSDLWTAEELAAYKVRERAPIVFEYDGWKITTAPPPSSGGIALAEMLQILEPWDLAELDATHRTHLVVEAMRRAYRDRTFYLGDPDFVEIPQRTLTSADYAASSEERRVGQAWVSQWTYRY